MSLLGLTPLHGFLSLLEQSLDKMLHPLKSTWHLLNAPSVSQLQIQRSSLSCSNHPSLLCSANYFSSYTIFLGAFHPDMESLLLYVSHTPLYFLITSTITP